jgi:dihydrofolate synthase/folylpolyglutamate synthase
VRDHPVLSEASRHGVRLGLNRMRSFLVALGSPHLAVPTLHVAGTNGKGSVVRMVASLLEAHGRSTGELSSPHLQEVNERIRYRGQPVSDAELEALLAELVEVRDRWAASEGLPQSPTGVPEAALLTYFELTTAAGFLHLAHQRPDAAVVEVGMGGRLDATNLVCPAVTAIVTVGIDHTAELGPDLGSIAAEKAGIAKAGVPMVLGPLEYTALRVVRAMAADRGAPLLLPDEHYRVAADRSGRLHFSMGDTVLDDLPLALPGVHQVHNAGVALAMVQTFLGPDQPLDPEACARALATVHHAGRLEWLGPDLLLDAAHNPAGAATLAAYLRSLPRDRPRTLLLGVSSDKDPRSMVVALEGVVDRVITTRCAHPRALPAGSLAEALVGVAVPVLPAGPVEQALPLAQAGGGLVIAAGSIFLTGAVRELVGAR